MSTALQMPVYSYRHNHGSDVVLHVVPEDWDEDRVAAFLTAGLVAEFGQEEVDKDTMHYGGLELHYTVEDGRIYDVITHDDERDCDVVRQYRVRFEEVVDAGD